LNHDNFQLKIIIWKPNWESSNGRRTTATPLLKFHLKYGMEEELLPTPLHKFHLKYGRITFLDVNHCETLG
jgi:hypothetical protein